jgi:hypothetical protein
MNIINWKDQINAKKNNSKTRRKELETKYFRKKITVRRGK